MTGMHGSDTINRTAPPATTVGSVMECGVRMEALTDCCQQEASRSLAKRRRVARCDGCNSLVLSYGDRNDYERTIAELTDNGVEFQVGSSGKLLIIAYQR